MTQLDDIAIQLSKHRLVPFYGAGASFPVLKLDWDLLRDEINGATTIIESDNLKAAQIFIDKFGKSEFSLILQRRLLISNFDDALGEVYHFLLSLNCFHYYTTNQDNVFEKCLEQYKRPFQTISVKESFVSMNPRTTTIFKFHGELNHPESIVFGTKDYADRMPISKDLASYNPLDISLISDTITKGMLFVGYSFRDPNIRELFSHITMIFGGNPPRSYLIEYLPNPAFETEMLSYNVECIDCTKHFPGLSIEDAFSATLSAISTKAYEARMATELDDFFGGSLPRVVPIKTAYEVNQFKKYIESTSDDVETSINRFRGSFDQQNVPDTLSSIVAESLKVIIGRITSLSELANLKGALFNLRLMNVGASVSVLLAYYIKLNEFSIHEDMIMERIHHFSVHIHSLPSKYTILVAAMALDFLASSGTEVSNLTSFIVSSVHSVHDIDELEDDQKEYVLHHFEVAFSRAGRYSNPLKQKFAFGRKTSFDEIYRNLSGSIPKKFKDRP